MAKREREKRSWIYIGHMRGTNEKDRKLGVIRWPHPMVRHQALVRARKAHPAYTIVRVR